MHEPPNGFRWKVVPERMDSAALEPGMLTSDEPGYYEAESHGIRTENLILCVEGPKTAYGQFLEFKTVTLCPIDLTPVLPELLEESERHWLNDYHEKVFTTLAPLLGAEEAAWLREVTRPL